jgi:predicted pyridoxine 5'-phosphate oxidase superfamily flavin-nucleotide-binding protein
MHWITTLDDLHSHYGQAGEAATVKVTPRLTPAYRAWIDRARFCVLTTVGPEGTDGSPRGDDGPVVAVLDPTTLALPDWHGNNRIDSLRNIVRDGRVSLMFLIPGALNALRVNGTARLTADAALLARFDRDGKAAPHRHRDPHRRGLFAMRPRADPRRLVDCRRPVRGPAHRRRHAARDHRRPDRRQGL